MKILSVMVLLLALVGCGSTSCPTCPSCLPCTPNADFNRDGIISGTDAINISIAIRDGVYDSVYDLNCDGLVNKNDVDEFRKAQGL